MIGEYVRISFYRNYRKKCLIDRSVYLKQCALTNNLHAAAYKRPNLQFTCIHQAAVCPKSLKLSTSTAISTEWREASLAYSSSKNFYQIYYLCIICTTLPECRNWYVLQPLYLLHSSCCPCCVIIIFGTTLRFSWCEFWDSLYIDAVPFARLRSFCVL